MTIRKHENNAATTLDGAINDSVTTISVTDASVFPTIGAGEVYHLTIFDGVAVEIVEVTGVSSNDLTVVRGAEGTTPAAYADLDDIELRPTADSVDRKSDITSVQDSTNVYAADGEASDTYVITLDPAPAAYATGQLFHFKANTANTGAATLNVNTLGAIAILKQNDVALATGDIEAGQIVTVVYDGTSFQMQSQLASSGGAGDMVLADIQTVTGAKSYNSGTMIYKGSVSGTTTLNASGIAGTTTITMPAESGSMVLEASTNTFTNKSFDANGTGNSLSNVDVSDLANGTDGELITWDAAGAPATVAVGTATHVLTSNGVGAAPTFQAAGGGGDPDQNLWETISSDSGSVAANTTTDTFTLTGGIGTNTSISGDVCTFDMDINGITTGTELAFFSTDKIAFYDGSVSAERTLSPEVFQYELIDKSADITTSLDVVADYIPVIDTSVFQPKKILPDNLVETVINNVSEVVVAAGDTFTFTDTSDSDNIKRDTVQGIIDLTAQAASQADQETGTSTTTYVSPGRQQYHESAVKAHFSVDQAGAPTTAIASYNILSLGDGGTGITDATIDVDMSSTSYTTVCSAKIDIGGGYTTLAGAEDNHAAGTFGVNANSAIGTAFDSDYVSCVVLGDQ